MIDTVVKTVYGKRRRTVRHCRYNSSSASVDWEGASGRGMAEVKTLYSNVASAVMRDALSSVGGVRVVSVKDGAVSVADGAGVRRRPGEQRRSGHGRRRGGNCGT